MPDVVVFFFKRAPAGGMGKPTLSDILVSVTMASEFNMKHNVRFILMSSLVLAALSPQNALADAHAEGSLKLFLEATRGSGIGHCCGVSAPPFNTDSHKEGAGSINDPIPVESRGQPNKFEVDSGLKVADSHFDYGWYEGKVEFFSSELRFGNDTAAPIEYMITFSDIAWLNTWIAAPGENQAYAKVFFDYRYDGVSHGLAFSHENTNNDPAFRDIHSFIDFITVEPGQFRSVEFYGQVYVKALTTNVPEPAISTMALVGLGVVGCAWRRRRQGHRERVSVRPSGWRQLH